MKTILLKNVIGYGRAILSLALFAASGVFSQEIVNGRVVQKPYRTALPNKTVDIWVTPLDGVQEHSGDTTGPDGRFSTELPTSVEDIGADVPSEYRLSPPYPQPSTDRTQAASTDINKCHPVWYSWTRSDEDSRGHRTNGGAIQDQLGYETPPDRNISVENQNK